MKTPAILLLVLLLWCRPVAAGEISIGSFLATATTDYLLDHQKEKIDFLGSSSSNTPYIDRIELRTETDEFRLSQQRYSVRVYPNGWGATASGRKVFEATKAYTESERDLLVHEALKKRYTLVNDMLHARRLSALKETLLLLYDDRVTVLKQRMQTVDFDVNDLIRAEDDYANLQLELIELESRTATLEDIIRDYFPAEGPVVFDAKNLAGIATITEILNQSTSAPGGANVHLQNAAARVALARNRLELEESENRKYISFLEGAYDSDEQRHNADEVFTVQLGIRFPFINSGRLDINRRKLDVLEEKARCEEQKRMLSERITVIMRTLKRQCRQHDYIRQQQEEGTAKAALQQYMRMAGADPLVLLDLRDSILERDVSLEKIRYEICTGYVDLLDRTGRLSAKPLVNFMSADLETLVP